MTILDQKYPLFTPTINQSFGLDEYAFAALFQQPIVYVKEYSKALGCNNAGFFLSYLISNTEPNQWFPLNANMIRIELGLTKAEYQSVRKKLLEQKVLKFKRSVKPVSQSLYCIDDDALDQLMLSNTINSVDLATPPLSINKLQLQAIAKKKDSIKATLFMATIQELLSCVEQLPDREDFSKWVEVTSQYINVRTNLSRRDQEAAKSLLLKAHILEIKKEGFPAQTYYRLSYQQLAVLTATHWNKVRGS
ncbi:hypothetical protein [Neisseria sp. Ec49-e6-T10]|uniref:hypothetical protein n=1 Tax=Neisseria sp. Ec49-e6-T10 TaxID=3140744 RepID=UPI003EBEF5A6